MTHFAYIKQTLVSWYTQILCRPRFFKFNQHLYNLSLRSIGVLNAHGDKLTGEEWLLNHLSTQFKQAGNHKPIIVDVGANTKVYGVDHFPHAEFWAFEPNPETFQLLTSNTPKSKRIRLIQQAVSSRSGKTKLYDFADDAKLKPTQPTATLASLNRSVIEKLHGQKVKSYLVKTTTIDSFAKTHQINHIDLLKIDVEGYELEVLKGAKNQIMLGKIDRIQFEFNQHHAYQRVLFKDFVDLLSNYQFFRLSPNGLLPIGSYRPQYNEIFAFQNILAVNHAILN